MLAFYILLLFASSDVIIVKLLGGGVEFKWVAFTIYRFIINLSIIIGYIVLYNMTSKYYAEIKTLVESDVQV